MAVEVRHRPAVAVEVRHRPALTADLLHLVERLHPVDLAAIVADHQRPTLLRLVQCAGQASATGPAAVRRSMPCGCGGWPATCLPARRLPAIRATIPLPRPPDD